MRSLELTEKRPDKTIVTNILYVNPKASDNDCKKTAKALNSLSDNKLIKITSANKSAIRIERGG